MVTTLCCFLMVNKWVKVKFSKEANYQNGAGSVSVTCS